MVDMFNAPIPGQSLTVPPKSRPWERPPQYTNPDKAMDYLFNNITNKKSAKRLLNLMDAQVPITGIVQGLLMTGVMEGKWTPDMVLMLTEPVTTLLLQMCKISGIKPNLEDLDDDEFDDSVQMLSSARKDQERDAALKSLPMQRPTVPMAPEMGPAVMSGGLMGRRGV